MEGVGPSCGLTKDHCCPGVSGAKRKGSQAQGAPHSAQAKATRLHKHGATHTHRATTNTPICTPDRALVCNCHIRWTAASHDTQEQPVSTHDTATHSLSTLTSSHTIGSQLRTTNTPARVRRPRRQRINTPDLHTSQNLTTATRHSKAPNKHSTHRHTPSSAPHVHQTRPALAPRVPTDSARNLRENDMQIAEQLPAPVPLLPTAVHSPETHSPPPVGSSNHTASSPLRRFGCGRHPRNTHAVQNPAKTPGTCTTRPHPRRPQELLPGNAGLGPLVLRELV